MPAGSVGAVLVKYSDSRFERRLKTFADTLAISPPTRFKSVRAVRSSKTPVGRLWITFRPRSNSSSEVRPSKISAGSVKVRPLPTGLLLCRLRYSSPVRPAKSPDWRLRMPVLSLLLNTSSRIAARCVVVMLAQLLTPDTSLTMTSLT